MHRRSAALVVAFALASPLPARVTLAAAGKNIAHHPVCAGPFSFVDRAAQDHITAERLPGYWNARAIHIDRITYKMIPNAAIRLENLEVGALDIAEQIPPTDVPSMLRHKNPHLIFS